jgi:hypothetical protein
MGLAFSSGVPTGRNALKCLDFLVLFDQAKRT